MLQLEAVVLFMYIVLAHVCVHIFGWQSYNGVETNIIFVVGRLLKIDYYILKWALVYVE